MDLSFLPHLNACLNALAAVLLLCGLVLVRGGRVAAHRRAMLAAFGVSALFLFSYVAHHAWRVAAQGGAHTPYHGVGWPRTAYYAILLSHIVLAMAVPPLAIVMIRLGWTGRIAGHRRLGRVAFPLWLYVSLTGVLIYLMLYHWNQVAT